VPGARPRAPGLWPDVEAAAVTRAAAELAAARGGAVLLRRARCFSLCAADAEDAVQRSIEILLTKGAAVDPKRLAAWMHVVVRREALAVRRQRERSIASDPLDHLESERAGPLERVERRERVAAAGRLLARLKPDERRAIALQAHGYSYAEIQAITGWSYTKVNRCLAEGRARLRSLVAWSDFL
jgi:RNA polymerase sigma factor (sigma-70 family)